MAWNKDDIDQFLGGGQKCDALLNQCNAPINQVDAFSSASSPAFTIPEKSTGVDDPDRYKIATYYFEDKESINVLKKYNKQYLRSIKFTWLCVIIAVLSFFATGIFGIETAIPFAILGMFAAIFNYLFGTLEIDKKANIYFKRTLVRSELSQHLIIDIMEVLPIDVKELSTVSPTITDLFNCNSNEELLAHLNLGGSMRNRGTINDLIRGSIGDVHFLFLECELSYAYYQNQNKNQPEITTLFKGQCFIFQTSVPIPFPVQYDFIPSDNSTNQESGTANPESGTTNPENGTSNPNDFYKLFRCYQYSPETDIYAGLVTNKNININAYKQLSQLNETDLNALPNDTAKASQYLLDSYFKSYYKQIDNIPQKFKSNLPRSEQEIMDVIESEEFQNTLLSIAQIHNNTRWSIRLINNNLIFIRPNCDTFEFKVSDKDIDGQIMNLEHDISDLIGIMGILSKLPVVRGHSEN